jgi:hypothetical protein
MYQYPNLRPLIKIKHWRSWAFLDTEARACSAWKTNGPAIKADEHMKRHSILSKRRKNEPA